MTDDGGVLGNLPRSRPGHRSEKRTQGTAARAGAAPRAEKTAAKASAPAAEANAGAPKRPRSAPPPQPEARPGDPVGDAIRTVTGVASTGARVAGGMAREVLRRLPRP